MKHCIHCGDEIDKRFGFWHLWRSLDSQFGDPEYCTQSRNHAHRP